MKIKINKSKRIHDLMLKKKRERKEGELLCSKYVNMYLNKDIRTEVGISHD